MQTATAIIPTWNEESWLPHLLKSLKDSAFISQIVVADNDSIDETVQLARVADCHLVQGGRPTLGRNSGANYATEVLLLFVDADILVNSVLLEGIQRQFENPSINLVFIRMVPMTSSRLIRACYRAVELYTWLSTITGVSGGPAPLICVRRHIFFEIGGFDPNVKVAEDLDLVHRVSRRYGGVKYLREFELPVSARRFKVESPILYVFKCIFWGLLRILGIRSSVFPYTWKSYPPELAKRDAAWHDPRSRND